ncbi:unnamed protein product [Cladocopium goreaui]|uniref:Uncharacterized protein n=1 Tax=Cladocopium goreaui TaxID=2562237 RepID=A0A9P1CM23_9DINO|nr:unnamed protein product [Cladocopium goreaui]
MWCCSPTIDSEIANVLPYAERPMTDEQATASTTSTASTASMSLKESLQSFRARALAMDPSLKEALPEVRKWHWKGSQVALTACDFVEGFLRGLEAHLPDVQVATQIIENQPSSVTLQVQLLNSVQATIATRSRIVYDVLLKDEASFTLSHQKGDSDQQEVCLEINGLEFWPLEDSVQLRKTLRELLGDDFTRTSVYQWWEEHKEEVCPLNSSKLRWVIESILGLRTVSAVTPPKGKEKMLWGFLHARRMVVERFTFREDCDRVRVTATVEAPRTDEEIELQAEWDELIAEMPQHELKLGEYFMSSSMNWLALFNSHLIGQSGADAARIIKLLSAAKRWGPGPDGWHQNDETWTCVDQKNLLGKITLEQGRVIWHHARNSP